MVRQVSSPKDRDRLESSIRFAYHNFDNLQALIRFADTKAGALMGFIFLLIGVGLGFLPKGFNNIGFPLCLNLHGVLSALFCVAWVIFGVAGSVAVYLLLVRGVLPRHALHYPKVDRTQDLMYWEHVVLHDTSASYRRSLHEMTNETELRTVSDQIYELAHIVRDKMAGIKRVRNWLFAATGAWFLGILTTILLMRGI